MQYRSYRANRHCRLRAAARCVTRHRAIPVLTGLTRRCGGRWRSRKLRGLVAAVLTGVMLACKSSHEAADEFVINVYGSRSAIETYGIGAAGLTPPEGQLGFFYNKYLRRFKAAQPLHELQGSAFLLETRLDGAVVHSIPVEPFVCLLVERMLISADKAGRPRKLTSTW